MPVGRPVNLPRPKVAAGQRNKRVTIERLTQTAGTTGFPVHTWAPLATVWMSREDARADERFSANQESAYYETVWRSEYRSDLDPDLVDVPKTIRFNFRDRIFDIRSATLLDRSIGIEYVTLASSTAAA